MKKTILVITGMMILTGCNSKGPTIDTSFLPQTSITVPSLPAPLPSVLPSPIPSITPKAPSVQEPSPVSVQDKWFSLEGLFKHVKTSCGSKITEYANGSSLVFNNNELEKWEPKALCNSTIIISKSYVIYDLNKMSQSLTHKYDYSHFSDCAAPKAEDVLDTLHTNSFVLKDNVLTIYSNDDCDGKGTKTTTVYKRGL